MTSTSSTAGRASALLGIVRKVGRGLRDPRFTRWRRYALLFSFVMVYVALLRIPGPVGWGDRFMHVWYHVFVVGWFGLLTYKLRTIGTREIVRFWLTGFFPVVLVAYFLSNPLEQLIGTGNFQTAVWVPAVEELIKVLPLFLWTTVLRPKHRHGTLSDFWILGFAIGAGFSFYEDALYQRLVASGFGHGLTGTLFPIFLTGSQFVITHAGWTALAAIGVGIFSLYRTRTWGWIVGLGFLLVPILDHAAVNWRGGGADFVRTVVLHGHLASTLLVITAVGAVAHDWYVLKWASTRDRLFPSPALRDDFTAVQQPGSIERKVSAVVARQRYRRMRNAAFCDLYRVRSHGKPAGDRRVIISSLARLANAANAPTGLGVHQP